MALRRTADHERQRCGLNDVSALLVISVFEKLAPKYKKIVRRFALTAWKWGSQSAETRKAEQELYQYTESEKLDEDKKKIDNLVAMNDSSELEKGFRALGVLRDDVDLPGGEPAPMT